MKERPILMSAPMVRALLDGSKTQTRRIVKPGKRESENPEYGVSFGNCPYGRPGDQLWVKENYRLLDSFDSESATRVAEMCVEAGYRKPWAPVQYEADGARENWQHVGTPPHDGRPKAGKLRPNIFLPRWASRITLEVTGVRVERLQDISEADARAEGCPCYVCGRLMDGLSEDDCHCFHRKASVSDYRNLWEQINGPGSWDANPWVWVVEFRRIDQARQAA